MSTSAGKYNVLNPTGRKPIAEVNWNKTDFEKEIWTRVDLYVVEFLKSEGVLKKFTEITEEIREFRQKIMASLDVMDNEWARLNPDDEETESSTFLIQLGLLTSPVWITALALGFGIPAAIFGGIVFAISSLFGLVVKTPKEIDDEYYKCIKSVPGRMHTLLEKQCGSNIRSMINKVTNELFQYAEALNERLHQISENRNEILANRKELICLVTQINTMGKCVTKLREDLNL